MYHQYYRPPAVYRQKGQGIATLISKFALPALRKLSPVIKSVVRKHGKSAVRAVGRAGYRAIKSKNKKEALKREMQREVARQLKKASKPRRKKKPDFSARRDIFTKL